MVHLSRQTLLEQLNNLPVATGQRYQHYKTQGIYIVLDIVILEATDQLAVLYADESHPQLKWVREYGDFTTTVDINGVQEPRFRLLD